MSSEMRDGEAYFELIGDSRDDGNGRVTLLPLAGDGSDVGKSARAVATGHEGDAEQLHHYWTRGEGLAKWADTPHPFRTLRRHLARYIHDPRELNATTAQWHHDALGFWPGKHKGK